MTDELNPAAGMDRRELLKRGVLVGGAGALMWAAPSVTKFANPAFGQTDGTPEGDGEDFSYIALRYQCGGSTAPIYAIKFEFGGTDANPKVSKCETGPTFKTPRGQNTQCDFDRTGVVAGNSDDCNLGGADPRFSVNFLDGLKTIQICLNHAGCLIDGVGVGKCGSPASVPEPCVYKNAHQTQCVTFALCGT